LRVTLLLSYLYCLTGMAAMPTSVVLEKEKHVGNDFNSVYDEEEVIAAKESDFKRKQVCGFGSAGIYS